MDNMPTGMMNEQAIGSFFHEFMQYVLSKTETFGDSDNESFAVKRQYYLYNFPAEFLKLREEIPELAHNPTIRRMFVIDGITPTIVLPKSGKMTQTVKATIRRDLSSLLYSDDVRVLKFAKALFCYSYYRDGFSYNRNSFGTFFDSDYWNSFPDVVELLRTFRTRDGISFSDLLANFRDQYLANHANTAFKKVQLGKDNYNDDGTLSIPKNVCFTSFSGGIPVTYIRADKKVSSEVGIYRIDRSSDRGLIGDDGEEIMLRYVPIPMFDEPLPVYNANSNVKDMQQVYYNNRRSLVQDAPEEKQELAQKKGKDAIGQTADAKSAVGNTVFDLIDNIDDAEQGGMDNAEQEDIYDYIDAETSQFEELQPDPENFSIVDNVESYLNQLNQARQEHLESLAGDMPDIAISDAEMEEIEKIKK